MFQGCLAKFKQKKKKEKRKILPNMLVSILQSDTTLNAEETLLWSKNEIIYGVLKFLSSGLTLVMRFPEKLIPRHYL